MVNKLELPESMKVIDGTQDYGTLFESNISQEVDTRDNVWESPVTNWVEFNDLDIDSYWKTKVFDKMYAADMKRMHGLAIVSKIMRDPSSVGGEECMHNINGAQDAIMFTGKIDWYEADESLGRIAGNRVGTMIQFPEDITDEMLDSLRIKIAGKVYDKSALDEHEGKKVLWYYPLVKSNEDEFKVTLVWGEETNSQDFYIFISPTSVLKEAEAAAEEETTTETTEEVKD